MRRIQRALDESTSDRWSRKQFKRRKAEEADSMRDWKQDLDRWLTTPPEDQPRGAVCVQCEINDGNNTHECLECLNATGVSEGYVLADEYQHCGAGDCPDCGAELTLMEDLGDNPLCPYHSEDAQAAEEEDTREEDWEDPMGGRHWQDWD